MCNDCVRFVSCSVIARNRSLSHDPGALHRPRAVVPEAEAPGFGRLRKQLHAHGLHGSYFPAGAAAAGGGGNGMIELSMSVTTFQTPSVPFSSSTT